MVDLLKLLQACQYNESDSADDISLQQVELVNCPHL